ncbi:hypothetical protein [Chryseolinea sp. H1M3-3]|uniref:hypothetical protein n=1 Tax=Chryseolinea sp. H1M3-3 TaxID=3034144 RepID=UPI0023EB61D0|nr:hypothetical protein [Chryseolinea sp. H1M3-3]
MINNIALKAIFLLSLACLLTSCSSDDPAPDKGPDQALIRMHVTPGYYNGDAYVVITDMDANVLCAQKIINGTDTSYYATDDYAGETINLYVVNQTPPYYHTSAYLNIKRGSDWGPPSTEGLRGVKNPIKIKLLNIPSFSYLTYGTNYVSWTASNISDTTGRTSFNYIEAGKAYAQVIHNGEGKHGFFDIDETNHSATVDLSSLQSSVKKNVVAPISGVLSGHFFLWGFETVGGYESNYLFMERSYIGAGLDVFYPSKSFSRYRSSFSYYTDTHQYIEVRDGSLNLDYQPIDFNAEIVNPNPANFSATFTGKFDYFYAYYTTADNKTFIHVYGAENTNNFSIPDFSGVVPMPKLDLSAFTLKYFQLNDLDGFEEAGNYFKYYSTKPLVTSARQRIVNVLK